MGSLLFGVWGNDDSQIFTVNFGVLVFRQTKWFISKFSSFNML